MQYLEGVAQPVLYNLLTWTINTSRRNKSVSAVAGGCRSYCRLVAMVGVGGIPWDLWDETDEVLGTICQPPTHPLRLGINLPPERDTRRHLAEEL